MSVAVISSSSGPSSLSGRDVAGGIRVESRLTSLGAEMVRGALVLTGRYGVIRVDHHLADRVYNLRRHPAGVTLRLLNSLCGCRHRQRGHRKLSPRQEYFIDLDFVRLLFLEVRL